MVSPLIQEGQVYEWYQLDSSLNVPCSLELKDNELLLYVNYFGVCQKQVEKVLKNYPPAQVVLDYSQAFFDPPKLDALATIYSPRKFFGIPDGGMLLSRCDVSQPQVQDMGSLSRMTHLLRRMCQTPEHGYSDYIHAEDSLNDSTPMAMSSLTHCLLKSIDYQAVQKKRMQNFVYLHSRLKFDNGFVFDVTDIVAPLCYPFITNIKGLRDYLIRNRIFVPTYWRDAIKRVSGDWTEKMIDGLLPLPIDQRYGKEEMEHMISLISKDV